MIYFKRYAAALSLLLGIGLYLSPALASAAVCAIYKNTFDGTDYGRTAGASFETVATPFTVVSTCTVTAVGENLGRSSGSPTDNGVLSIASNLTGAGTLLESGTAIPYTAMGTVGGAFVWATSTFAGTTVLSPGTTYYVYIARSGALNNSNYFNTEINTTTGTYGGYYGYNGTSWSSQQTHSISFEVDGTVSAGGGGSALYPSGQEIFATTTTFSIIDDPVADLFYGFVVFFISFLGMVWLLRRK